MKRWCFLLAVLPLMTACTAVDATEWCVATRYGKVTEQRMSEGLNGTFFENATCFPTTEQNHTMEQVQVRTRDPVTLTVEGITVIWEYPEDVYTNVFLDKRSHENAVREIGAGIEEGIKNAFNRYTFAEVNGDKLPEISSAISEEVQKKVGRRAVIKNTLLSGRIEGPPSVEAERVRTMEQQQALQTAMAAMRTDSINNARMLANENAKALVKEMSAKAYEKNPALLQLEIARELKGICGQSTTCILGGTTLDVLGVNLNGRR